MQPESSPCPRLWIFQEAEGGDPDCPTQTIAPERSRQPATAATATTSRTTSTNDCARHGGRPAMSPHPTANHPSTRRSSSCSSPNAPASRRSTTPASPSSRRRGERVAPTRVRPRVRVSCRRRPGRNGEELPSSCCPVSSNLSNRVELTRHFSNAPRIRPADLSHATLQSVSRNFAMPCGVLMQAVVLAWRLDFRLTQLRVSATQVSLILLSRGRQGCAHQI